MGCIALQKDGRLPVQSHENLNVFLLVQVEHGEQRDNGAKYGEVDVVAEGDVSAATDHVT